MIDRGTDHATPADIAVFGAGPFGSSTQDASEVIMKATELLRKQHDTVKSALEELLEGEPSRKALEKIADDLAGHMTIEQELFYPSVHEFRADLILESYEEHAMAELELKRALEAAPEDPAFVVRVRVLKELLEHHIEEEENELFPAVEAALGANRLEDLGARMEKTFSEIRGSGYAALLPQGFARTSSDEDRKVLFGAAGTDGIRTSASPPSAE